MHCGCSESFSRPWHSPVDGVLEALRGRRADLCNLGDRHPWPPHWFSCPDERSAQLITNRYAETSRRQREKDVDCRLRFPGQSTDSRLASSLLTARRRAKFEPKPERSDVTGDVNCGDKPQATLGACFPFFASPTWRSASGMTRPARIRGAVAQRCVIGEAGPGSHHALSGGSRPCRHRAVDRGQRCRSDRHRAAGSRRPLRHAPANYPRGSRECQITDLDDHVLRFGSDLRAGEPIGDCLDASGQRWLPDKMEAGARKRAGRKRRDSFVHSRPPPRPPGSAVSSASVHGRVRPADAPRTAVTAAASTGSAAGPHSRRT